MKEPDRTNQEEEVDGSSEQMLSMETNSMHTPVKTLMQTANTFFPIHNFSIFYHNIVTGYYLV